MNLRKIVKSNTVLNKFAYFIRDCIYSIQLRAYKNLEIDKNTVLFNSFNGKGYGDNPKAIAERLHELEPNVKIVWAYKDDDAKQSLPSYVVPVRFQSRSYYRTLSIAAVWVFNVLIPNGTVKKKGQYYIQTWHGDRAIKKILNDALEDDNFLKSHSVILSEKDLCDYMVVGCEWFIPVWRRASSYKGEILKVGMPRNDRLLYPNDVNNKKTVEKVKRIYRIPEGAGILLYAPTFRDHKLENNIVDSTLDIPEILKVLQKKDKRKWVCFMRAHDGAMLKINGTISNRANQIDVSSYPDMTDLLLTADMLITDYSSCAGDFALTGRPIILYQDDYNEYIKNDRSLYFAMQDSPYLYANDMDGLKEIIASIDEKSAAENCKRILDFYQAIDAGHGADSVCKVILGRVRGIEEG